MAMNKSQTLKTLWFTPGTGGRWGLPMLFTGHPGTAKTAVLTSVAAQCGLHSEVIIASIREPADFLGIPTLSNDGKRMVYAAPPWAVRAAEAGRCIVFLDEINTAPPAVMAALLRVINESMVGDLKLPPGVRFVAAMNYVNESAGGGDLPGAMANRFGHCEWTPPTADEYCAFLLSGGGIGLTSQLEAAAEEARVEAAFPSAWAKASGLVSGFIRRRPELLHKQPGADDPQLSKAWPSPRTWEMGTRAIAGAEVHGRSMSEGEWLLSGYVGQGAAVEFTTWRKLIDLPDPADLLDGKVSFDHDPARLDRTLAVASSCAALVAPKGAERRIERATRLWGILESLLGQAPDLIVPAATTLVVAKLSAMPEAKLVLKKVSPVLRNANVNKGV